MKTPIQALDDRPRDDRYPTVQGVDEWYGIQNSSEQAFWPDSDSLQKDAGVKFTHIMTATKGQKPKKHQVYGRAKRATIVREIRSWYAESLSSKARK